MSLAGVLLAGQVASGREVARAQLRLWCGTWEILASKLPVMVEWPGKGSASSSRNCEGSSTVAGQEVGPPGSSEEALVMGWSEAGGLSRSVARSTSMSWEEPGERARWSG